MQVQYQPWPLRNITDCEVAETGVEFVPPRAAAGPVVSGRDFTKLIAVRRGTLQAYPLTLHVLVIRTLGTFLDLMSVPMVHCIIYDFPSGCLQISRRG